MVAGRTLNANQLPWRCTQGVLVCADDSSMWTRSAPKANPQSLSTITRFTVGLSYFGQCAQSVLRPGLELKLQSIKIHLDSLPLNLPFRFMPQKGTYYEVTASSDFHLVSLVLVFGKNMVSISPSPTSPQSHIWSLGGLGKKTRAVLKKPPVPFAGGWGIGC